MQAFPLPVMHMERPDTPRPGAVPQPTIQQIIQEDIGPTPPPDLSQLTTYEQLQRQPYRPAATWTPEEEAEYWRQRDEESMHPANAALTRASSEIPASQILPRLTLTATPLTLEEEAECERREIRDRQRRDEEMRTDSDRYGSRDVPMSTDSDVRQARQAHLNPMYSDPRDDPVMMARWQRGEFAPRLAEYAIDFVCESQRMGTAQSEQAIRDQRVTPAEAAILRDDWRRQGERDRDRRTPAGHRRERGSRDVIAEERNRWREQIEQAARDAVAPVVDLTTDEPDDEQVEEQEEELPGEVALEEEDEPSERADDTQESVITTIDLDDSQNRTASGTRHPVVAMEVVDPESRPPAEPLRTLLEQSTYRAREEAASPERMAIQVTPEQREEARQALRDAGLIRPRLKRTLTRAEQKELEMRREQRQERWNQALRAQGYAARGRRRSITPRRAVVPLQHRLRTLSAARPEELPYQPEPLAGVPVEYRPPSPTPSESMERLLVQLRQQPGPSSRPDIRSLSGARRAGIRMDPGAGSSRLLADEKSPGNIGDVVFVARYRPGRATNEAAGVEIGQDVHGNVYNLRELSRRELSKYPLPPQDADKLERSWDDYSSPSPIPVPAQDTSGKPKRSIFEKVARGKRCPVKRRHAYTPTKVTKRTIAKRKCVRKTPSPKKSPTKSPKKKAPRKDENNNNADEIMSLAGRLQRVSMHEEDLDKTLTGGACHQADEPSVAEGQQMTIQPTTGQPTVKQPTIIQPATERPMTRQRVLEQPTTVQETPEQMEEAELSSYESRESSIREEEAASSSEERR